MLNRTLFTKSLRLSSMRAFSTAAPSVRPANPKFCSGPCPKRPGYSLDNFKDAAHSIQGRSHRAKEGKARIAHAINLTKKILDLPSDYKVGIVPASDTGAVEMAMWSMLGPRPVDVVYQESFGKGWHNDIANQLKLEHNKISTEEYGELPDLSKVNPKNDCIFTFNGTTSGVKVPKGNEWIAEDREGLTIADSTSAIFAQDMKPYNKLDVITYSWQKVLGGEGGHGMLILGPRAVERLESHTPSWPIPKIFGLTKKGKLIEGIFKDSPINTPSMLCIEDYIDALNWVESIGGLEACHARADANLAAVSKFVESHDSMDFLCKDPSVRSNTSVCVTLDATADEIKKITTYLADEGVAFDIGAYRDAPPSLRIWCGATVETSDLEALMPWIEHAYQKVKAGEL